MSHRPDPVQLNQFWPAGGNLKNPHNWKFRLLQWYSYISSRHFGIKNIKNISQDSQSVFVCHSHCGVPIIVHLQCHVTQCFGVEKGEICAQCLMEVLLSKPRRGLVLPKTLQIHHPYRNRLKEYIECTFHAWGSHYFYLKHLSWNHWISQLWANEFVCCLFTSLILDVWDSLLIRWFHCFVITVTVSLLHTTAQYCEKLL